MKELMRFNVSGKTGDTSNDVEIVININSNAQRKYQYKDIIFALEDVKEDVIQLMEKQEI